MWTYRNSTGDLFRKGAHVATGYSGSSWGRNNPAAEAAPDIGPIPVGSYRMVQLYDSARVGPCAILLHALDGNPDDDIEGRTGRAGFRIHGDSIAHPGQASHGCIILPRPVRLAMWQSGDHALEVVA